MSEPAVMNAEAICPLIEKHRPALTGDAAPRLSKEIFSSDIFDVEILPVRSVAKMVLVASIAEKILSAKRMAPDTLSPLYLRPPEAKIFPMGGRLK